MRQTSIKVDEKTMFLAKKQGLNTSEIYRKVLECIVCPEINGVNARIVDLTHELDLLKAKRNKIMSDHIQREIDKAVEKKHKKDILYEKKTIEHNRRGVVVRG